MSLSATMTRPTSAAMVPQIRDKSVDLPDPLSPNNRTVSPGITDSLGIESEKDARPGQRKRTSFKSKIGPVDVT